MLIVLITFAHFSVSSVTSRPKSAGEPASAVRPISATATLIFGSGEMDECVAAISLRKELAASFASWHPRTRLTPVRNVHGRANWPRNTRYQANATPCFHPLDRTSLRLAHSFDDLVARPSSGSETVRPSALAVLRLIISSNLTARSTGRGATLWPASQLVGRSGVNSLPKQTTKSD